MLVKVRVKLDSPAMADPILVTLNICEESVHATGVVTEFEVNEHEEVIIGTALVGKTTRMTPLASSEAGWVKVMVYEVIAPLVLELLPN